MTHHPYRQSSDALSEPPSQQHRFNSKHPSRHGIALKRVLVLLAAVVGLLVLLIGLFGPRAAGIVIKGLAESRGSDALGAEVRIDSVSLGWSGPQKISGLQVVASDGSQVARFDHASIKRSVWSLAAAPMDLGVIEIRGGSLSVEQSKDGSYRLAGIDQETGPASSSPPTSDVQPERSQDEIRSAPIFQLPADLRCALQITDVRIDAMTKGSKLSMLVKEARLTGVGAGEVIEASLQANAMDGAAVVGTIELSTTASGLIDSNGEVRLEPAVVDHVYAHGDLPNSWAAAIDAMAFGTDITADLIDPTGTAIRFDLDLKKTGSVLQSQGTQTLFQASVTPGVAGLLTGGARVRVEGTPSVSVDANSLTWPASIFSAQGIQDGLLNLTARMDTFEATVLDDMSAVTAGSRIQIQSSPFILDVDLRSSGRARLDGSLLAELNGSALGELSFDFGASDFINSDGALAPIGTISVEGEMLARNISTGVIERFIPTQHQSVLGLLASDDSGIHIQVLAHATGSDADDALAIEALAYGDAGRFSVQSELREEAVRTTGSGIKFQTVAASTVLTQLLGSPDTLQAIGGDHSDFRLSITDLTLPTTGEPVSINDVRATVQLSAEGVAFADTKLDGTAHLTVANGIATVADTIPVQFTISSPLAALNHIGVDPLQYELENGIVIINEPDPIELRITGANFALSSPLASLDLVNASVTTQRVSGTLKRSDGSTDPFQIEQLSIYATPSNGGETHLKVRTGDGDITLSGDLRVQSDLLEAVSTQQAYVHKPKGDIALRVSEALARSVASALGTEQDQLDLLENGIELLVQSTEAGLGLTAAVGPARIDIESVGSTDAVTVRANARISLDQRTINPMLAGDLSLRNDSALDIQMNPVEITWNDIESSNLESPLTFNVSTADPVQIATDSSASQSIELRSVDIATTLDPTDGSGTIEGGFTLVDPAQGSELTQVIVQSALPGFTDDSSLQLIMDDTAAIDRWLGQQAGSTSLQQSLGDSARIDARITLNQPTALRIDVQSTKLETSLGLRTLGDKRDEGFELTEPIDILLTLPRSFAGQLAGEGIAFREDIPTAIRVKELATGPLDDPLNPETFFLEAEVVAEDITLRTRNGSETDLGVVTTSLSTTKSSPPEVVFELLSNTSSNTQTNQQNQRLITATGRYVLTEPAQIHTAARSTLPPGFLDAALDANGWLSDALGNEVTMEAALSDIAVDMSRGTFTVLSNSPRSSLTINGIVRPDVVELQSTAAPTSLELRELTPRWATLVGVLMGADPQLLYSDSIDLLGESAIGVASKSANDDPFLAFVPSGTSFSLPTNGDLAKLDGDFTIDTGGLTFSTAQSFGNFVDFLGGNTMGNNVEPLTEIRVRAIAGVVQIEPFEMRIGDVTFESRAMFDFVKKRYERVLFIKPTEIKGDLARAVDRVPGLRNAVRIPIRHRSGYGQPPRWELAMDLLGDEILAPENVGNILDNVLGDLFGNKKEDDDERD